MKKKISANVQAKFDNVSGLAKTITAFAEGILPNIKSTILITVEKILKAAKKASSVYFI